jgi:hypothetical protein
MVGQASFMDVNIIGINKYQIVALLVRPCCYSAD